MRLLTAALLFVLTIIGCNSNHLEGVYVCTKLPIKESVPKENTETPVDTTNPMHESIWDERCLVEQLDFRRHSSVVIKLPGGELETSYVIDKDYIRIKGNKSELVLKIKDDNTLLGEGMMEGSI